MISSSFNCFLQAHETGIEKADGLGCLLKLVQGVKISSSHSYFEGLTSVLAKLEMWMR
jgi:hypothetical protein